MLSDVQSLEASALKLEEKAAAARAKIAETQAAEIESYDRRELEYDRKMLESYDAQAIETAKTEAFRAFERAVIESPLGNAWANYRAAVVLAQQLAGEAQSAATRLGIERRIPTPGPGAGDLLSAINVAVDREAGARAGEAMDERWRERERFAAGESHGS